MYKYFFGVDFSGGDEGSKKQLPLWVARGTSGGDTFRIESLSRLNTRADLTNLILESRDAIWGLDFPFSFPEPFLKEYFGTAKTWSDLLRHIHQLSLDTLHEKIENFRTRHGQGEKHPWRDTERDFQKIAVSALNERMFRMVFHGMWLLGHVRADCDVLPWDSGTKMRVIIEIFPGATVNFLGCDAKGYKGKGPADKSERHEILERVSDGNKLGFLMDFASGNFEAECYTYDDALDAVMAAATVFWCCQRPDRLKPRVGWNQLEGWIFGPGR